MIILAGDLIFATCYTPERVRRLDDAASLSPTTRPTKKATCWLSIHTRLQRLPVPRGRIFRRGRRPAPVRPRSHVRRQPKWPGLPALVPAPVQPPQLARVCRGHGQHAGPGPGWHPAQRQCPVGAGLGRDVKADAGPGCAVPLSRLGRCGGLWVRPHRPGHGGHHASGGGRPGRRARIQRPWRRSTYPVLRHAGRHQRRQCSRP